MYHPIPSIIVIMALLPAMLYAQQPTVTLKSPSPSGPINSDGPGKLSALLSRKGSVIVKDAKHFPMLGSTVGGDTFGSVQVTAVSAYPSGEEAKKLKGFQFSIQGGLYSEEQDANKLRDREDAILDVAESNGVISALSIMDGELGKWTGDRIGEKEVLYNAGRISIRLSREKSLDGTYRHALDLLIGQAHFAVADLHNEQTKVKDYLSQLKQQLSEGTDWLKTQ